MGKNKFNSITSHYRVDEYINTQCAIHVSWMYQIRKLKSNSPWKLISVRRMLVLSFIPKKYTLIIWRHHFHDSDNISNNIDGWVMLNMWNWRTTEIHTIMEYFVSFLGMTFRFKVVTKFAVQLTQLFEFRLFFVSTLSVCYVLFMAYVEYVYCVCLQWNAIDFLVHICSSGVKLWLFKITFFE